MPRTHYGPVVSLEGFSGQDNYWASIMTTYTSWGPLWMWEVFYFQTSTREYVNLVNDNGVITETRTPEDEWEG